MNISISTDIFVRENIGAWQLDAVKSGGFDTLDFCGYQYAWKREAGFYLDNWREWIGNIKEMADARGIRFNQTHNAIFNYFAENEEQAIKTECVWRIIEATAMLGAKYTVIHPVAPPGMEHDRAACLRINRDFYLRASDVAAKHGVTVCAENMMDHKTVDGRLDRQYCTSALDLLELVEAIDRENVKVCIDIGHAHFMGEEPAKMIAALGKYLRVIHVQDNDARSDQHVLPYCGTIDWTRTMEALACAGYPGDLTFEVQNSFFRLPPELFPQALRYGHAVGEKLREIFENKRAQLAQQNG